MIVRTLGAVSLAVSATVGWAAGAHADYIQNQGTYAGDVLRQLQDWGYDVMLNGLGRDVLYMDAFQQRHCQVLGTHPTVSGPLESGQFQTVYVDLSCAENPNSLTNTN